MLPLYLFSLELLSEAYAAKTIPDKWLLGFDMEKGGEPDGG